MSTKNILVTGGAGFIGSHVVKMLDQYGYHPIVFDNLSRGNEKAVTRGTFVKGDLNNTQDLEKIFSSYDIKAVMHFAAFIDVGESMLEPAKYYINNVVNTINLLEAMRKHGIKIFIFSSTAAIFGLPQQTHIGENHPCVPINPYGETKLIVEKILRDYASAYDLRYTSLRYFNAAGGDPEGEIKNYKVKESNLIPIVLRSLMQPNGIVTINGTDYPTPDGTCIRDYIHVNDLGDAHILAMERLLKGASSENYNLGNGNGFSVRDVISAAETATGKLVRTKEGARRPGDPPQLVADSHKARKDLGWSPRYSDLKVMVAHAWQALNNCNY